MHCSYFICLKAKFFYTPQTKEFLLSDYCMKYHSSEKYTSPISIDTNIIKPEYQLQHIQIQTQVISFVFFFIISFCTITFYVFSCDCYICTFKILLSYLILSIYIMTFLLSFLLIHGTYKHRASIYKAGQKKKSFVRQD